MRRIISRLAVGAALLLLVAAIGLTLFRSTYDGKVYPSVAVADVPVGGLARADAEARVEQRVQDITDATATFQYAGKTWTPTLGELGVSLDAAAAMDAAYGLGREESARARIQTAFDLARNDVSVPIALTLDDQKLTAWFDQVDRDLGPPPHDAQLVVSGGTVTVDPDVDGTVVDRDRARQSILTGLAQLTAFSGDLPVISRPATIHAADLQPAYQQISAALAKPIALTYESQSWTLQPSDLSPFVTTTIDPAKSGADAVTVEVDKGGLAGWLSQMLGDSVNLDPQDADVSWGGDGVGAIATGPSVDGTKLMPVKLADEVIGSLLSDHAAVTIPVAIVKPKVDAADVASLGITTLLGVGDSNFDGSDDSRATNIQVGVSLLNGTLIPPRTAFSFNHAIGEITADKGYVTAQVIDGERIARDIGGGICQVSTTVYRAAFLAGLPIVELHPHRYRLKFYEYDGWQPGVDASILQPAGNPFAPGGDFQFMNPSDSWMLVEAYTQGVYAYVKIYGADLGYTVNVSGPVYGDEPPPTDNVEVVDDTLDAGTIMQSEWAAPGLIVSYERQVLDRNGDVVEDEPFVSNYSARSNVWRVSPDMQGLSPAYGG